MTTVDWIIIGIIALSTVVSLWRGATREIFSLITWAAAIYIGVKFAGHLDGIFSSLIQTQSVRFAVGFIVLFLLVMIVGGLLNHLLSRFISLTGLTFLDRILGVVFGVARGILILTVMVVLAKYTTVPKDSWWQSSQLLPHFNGISDKLSAWVQDHGFDPKKLETMMESIDDKPGDKNSNKPQPVSGASVSPEDTNKNTKHVEQTTDVLGVPVSKQDPDHNVLGGPVADDSKPGASNMLGVPLAPAPLN